MHKLNLNLFSMRRRRRCWRCCAIRKNFCIFRWASYIIFQYSIDLDSRPIRTSIPYIIYTLDRVEFFEEELFCHYSLKFERVYKQALSSNTTSPLPYSYLSPQPFPHTLSISLDPLRDAAYPVIITTSLIVIQLMDLMRENSINLNFYMIVWVQIEWISHLIRETRCIARAYREGICTIRSFGSAWDEHEGRESVMRTSTILDKHVL